MIDAPTGNDNYTCLACPWRNEAMFSRALSCNVCSLGRGSPFAIGQKAGSEAISLRIHMSYVGQSSDFYLLKIHAITESQTASLDPITGPNLRRSSFTLPSTGSICYPCVIHWIRSNLPSQSWSKLRKCPFTIRLVPAKKTTWISLRWKVPCHSCAHLVQDPQNNPQIKFVCFSIL